MLDPFTITTVASAMPAILEGVTTMMGGAVQSEEAAAAPEVPESPADVVPAAAESLDEIDIVMQRLFRMAENEHQTNKRMLDDHVAAGQMIINGRAALTIQELAKKPEFFQ